MYLHHQQLGQCPLSIWRGHHVEILSTLKHRTLMLDPVQFQPKYKHDVTKLHLMIEQNHTSHNLQVKKRDVPNTDLILVLYFQNSPRSTNFIYYFFSLLKYIISRHCTLQTQNTMIAYLHTLTKTFLEGSKISGTIHKQTMHVFISLVI